MSDTDTDHVAEAVHIASAYADTGNYERARDVLRRALATDPHDSRLLVRHAQAEHALGNYAGAAWSAYGALAVAPENEFAMRLYASSLDALGRSWDALCVAWRAVLTHPNEPLVHLAYARLLQQSWQLPNALYAADQAVRLAPHDADAHVLRGSILHDLRRIPESTESYRAALALDPGNCEALNNLAVNGLHRRRFGHALRGFLAAAGGSPEIGDLARRNIAAVLERVFQVVTVAAGVLGFIAGVVVEMHSEGKSTAPLRLLAGLLTTALIVVFVWVLRSVPRQVLSSVLRQHRLVSLRVLHALLAVLAGAWATIFAWPVGILPVCGLLVFSGLILFRVGLRLFS
ncbi:MAG: tetratricopeptide repeat protein [Mycobacterium pseudokansasii]|nr:tetratricopeptide repeat protein [Mycobacterium pseudokansasii]